MFSINCTVFSATFVSIDDIGQKLSFHVKLNEDGVHYPILDVWQIRQS